MKVVGMASLGAGGADGVEALRSPIPTDEVPLTDPGGEVTLLVARAKRGDPEAFALLYRRHVDRVYAFAARRLNSRGAAEEATQETFSRALAGLGRCRDDAAFAGWLFAIARHVVNEDHRAWRRTAPLEEWGEPENPDPTPEERALRAEGAAALRAARDRCLSAKERELFDLLVLDLTDREIAVALGRRWGAVRTAHWRLLVKLRGCLGAGGHQEGGRRAAP